MLGYRGTLYIFIAMLLSGCMSNQSGTSALSSDKANQIQKGVTTRAEIESMFGPPTNVAMLPGGKRMMSYYFTQTNAHATGATYIPLVGMFAGGAEGQSETRTLQVNLDANGVVEDYQYNDSTNKLHGGGVLGTSVTSTPVTGESSGK